jgi:uncharacterized lipoprotein YmbA
MKTLLLIIALLLTACAKTTTPESPCRIKDKELKLPKKNLAQYDL